MFYPELDRSHYLSHAQTELRLAGFYDRTDPAYETNRIMADHLMGAIESILDSRTSEYSLPLILDSIIRLLTQRNLAPITSDPREWQDISPIMGTPLWQNRRNPYVYSKDAGETFMSVEHLTKTDRDGLPRESHFIVFEPKDFEDLETQTSELRQDQFDVGTFVIVPRDYPHAIRAQITEVDGLRVRCVWSEGTTEYDEWFPLYQIMPAPAESQPNNKGNQ